jgi:hypothetical protein
MMKKMKSRSYRGKSQLGGKKAAGVGCLYNPGKFLPGKLDCLHMSCLRLKLYLLEANLQPSRISAELLECYRLTLKMNIRVEKSGVLIRAKVQDRRPYPGAIILKK